MRRPVRTQVLEDGAVVIPEELRDALGIRPGDRVLLVIEDGELRVFTPAQGIKRAQELVRRYVPEGVSLVDELIAERRAEAARE